MYVIKRNGTLEEVDFNKVVQRLKYTANEPYPLNDINIHSLAQIVIQGLHNNIHTKDIDIYSSNICASSSVKNQQYGILAGRIVINNHQKNTLTSFKDKMDKLYIRKDKQGNICPLLDEKFYKFVLKNQKEIENYIDYSRDYTLDYFSFKTLEKSYLLKDENDVIVERPQDMFMRVSIFLHMVPKLSKEKTKPILDKIFETYDFMSKKYFTHATPTLFNAGLQRAGCLSCFLLGTEDSLEGIMKTSSDCAQISKWSGGIGFHVSNWRSKGALIRKTNGKSNGIIPFLRIFNDVARAFNQGGKRLGSFAVYIEMHHPDIMDFLQLRKNHGEENLRCRDLFLALWICDLFMERVKNNSMWSLFDPDECPGLNEVYGKEYEKLYCEYEEKKMYREQLPAREIWKAVFISQKESGIPYILYKDHINRHNNQSNIGVIKSSNLCAEIVEVSNSEEYACCTLASICLSSFVEDSISDEDKTNNLVKLNHEFPKRPIFNYKKLIEVIQVIVRNLNQVIDRNWYPTPETEKSNLNHRPLGIGVQGLADVFYKFKCSYDSPLAKELNKKIFETIYYASISASTKLSREIYKNYKQQFNSKKLSTITIDKKEYNLETLPTTIGSYSSITRNEGSPLFNGKFHWELYGLNNDDLKMKYDWNSLRDHIKTFGIRNSLLIALMPTASTSQIMGNIESIEPLTSNIFKRQTLAGEFIVINKYLMNDLKELNLWNDEMENYLKMNNGSIQNIQGIPNDIKSLYRTVWEISQQHIIDLASDRQPFVDQSQSMNLFIEDLTFSKFNSMHFYSWQKKLKTGCYYLRTRPAVLGQQFTVVPNSKNNLKDRNEILQLNNDRKFNIPVQNDDEEICLVCSS
jgi:ribonucleoside-diphosphate reductase alpha chain